MKIENQSRKLSHKPDGVGRNRTVLLSSNFANESNAFDPVKTRLSESQAEAEEPTNPSASSQALWVQPDTKQGITTPTIQLAFTES